MVVLLVIGWLLIRSSGFQTWTVNKLAERIEQKYGGYLQVGNIFIRWPKKLIAKDVLLKDQLGDTLCFIPEISAGMRKIDLKNRDFDLGRIQIREPYLQLLEDPGGGNNFDFFIEMISSEDTARNPVFIQIQQINLSDARLKFKKFGTYPVRDIFTPENFEISDLDMNLMKFGFNPDSLSFKLRNLKFREMSGFSVEDLEGDFVLQNDRFSAQVVTLATSKSSLNIPSLDFVIPTADNDKTFAEKLDLNFRVANPSILDPEDIRYFYPDIEDSRDQIRVLGDFRFTPAEWQALNTRLLVGEWLGFDGDILITNPSEFKRAGYNTMVDTLWFDLDQARDSYFSLLVDLDTMDLPFVPELIGNVYFTGSVKGRKNDFSAEGDLKSGAGAFRGVFSVHPEEDGEDYAVTANYRASLIHFDNFTNLETGIGLISADGSLEGTWDGDSVYSIKTETILPFINWNGYYYANVNIKSIIQNKLYEAAIFVDDEYGMLDFAGKLNLRADEPFVDFDISVGEADLTVLNLYPHDSIAFLDLNMHGSFSGKKIDNIEGQVWVEDSRFSNSRGEIPVEELSLEVSRELGGKKINLVSEYIDGRMVGEIYLDDLIGQITEMSESFIPLKRESKAIHKDRYNNFIFNIHFKNPKPLTDVLASNLVFKENTKLSGFFNYGIGEMEIEGSSPQYLIGGNQFTNLKFSLYAFEKDLDIKVDLEKLQFDRSNIFNDIQFTATRLSNSLETRLTWKGKNSARYTSEINPTISFEPGQGVSPRVIIDLPNSTIFFKEKQWELSDSKFEIDKRFFEVSDLRVSSQNEHVLIDGIISDNPADTLYLSFNALDIGLVNQFSANEGFELSGLIDGNTKVFNFYNGGLFLADLLINDFVINGEKIGQTEVRSQRDESENDILINLLTRRGVISTLQMDGRYSPKTDNLDFVFKLDKLRLSIFNPFLSPVFSNVNGIATGEIVISGNRKQPVMDGLINVQKGGLTVDYLNTRYTFTHPILVKENAFLVENLLATDRLGNVAIVNGGIRHTNFRNLNLDFRINGTNFLFLDTDEFNGDGYWGTALGTGDVWIKGPLHNIEVNVSARTSAGTRFSIPVSGQGKVREMDFITYVVHDQPDEDPDLISYDSGDRQTGYNANLNNLQVHLDIDITPEAEALIIFDAQVGDVLRGRGTGSLQIDINSLGLFTLNGGFNIDEGEYLFTLQNMPIKRFAIEPGSTISWSGKVEEAELDIDAVYTTRAALYDLILEEGDGLTERVPVTCHLLMAGILESPDISFAINLPPNSDDVARSQLEGLTKDELNKQLFSLLILNRFQPLPGLNSSYTSRSYGSAGLATTTEVLSSQLNYWLSQISSEFDIGFNYRPGDQITSDEVEVALSTQIFNDRMIINLNGNVDMRSSQGETNQLVGDVEVEYKIKPSGRVRVKAFNRSNDRLIYEYSPYTQGLGLFFREEFNTLGDLYRKYRQRIVGKEKPVNK